MSWPRPKTSAFLKACFFRFLVLTLFFPQLLQAGEADLISALKTKPQTRPLEAILADLENPDSRIRWLAVQELGWSGRLETVPAVLLRLGDRNLEVRRTAREALLNLGRGREALVAKAIDDNLDELDLASTLVALGVREELSGYPDLARGKYHQAYLKDHRRLWAAYWAYDISALVPKTSEAVRLEIENTATELEKSLAEPGRTYPETVLRRAYGLTILAQALGRRGGRRVIELLASGRREKALAFRTDLSPLVSASGRLAHLAKEFELLLADRVEEFKLSDDNPWRDKLKAAEKNRARAAIGLGGVSGPKAEAALIEALTSDPSPEVRAAAALGLGGQAGPGAAKALLEAFEPETSFQVRLAVIKALGCLTDSQAKKFLMDLAPDDDYKETALLALGCRPGPQEIDFLLKAAQDRSFYDPGDSAPDLAGPDAEAVLTAVAGALELAAENSRASQADGLRAEARKIRTRAWADPEETESEPRKPAPDPQAEESVRKTVRDWIEAWRTGNLDRFMALCHPEFMHRGMNKEKFRAYKKELESRQKILSIKAEDLKVRFEGDRAVATYIQEFTAEGYQDRGLKKLILKRLDSRWLIYRTAWKPLDDSEAP